MDNRPLTLQQLVRMCVVVVAWKSAGVHGGGVDLTRRSAARAGRRRDETKRTASQREAAAGAAGDGEEQGCRSVWHHRFLLKFHLSVLVVKRQIKTIFQFNVSAFLLHFHRSQQSWNSWNCKVVLKSQSNVLILTIVVRAQWHFNVLLAALLICLLHMWIQFYVLSLSETVTIMVSCVTLPF